MKERPIIMTSESVRAILDGRKTMTRRVITGFLYPEYPDHEYCFHETVDSRWEIGMISRSTGEGHFMQYSRCPYGVPGSSLWVKESWANNIPGCPNGLSYKADHIDPLGDGPAHPMKWKSPIFMPRWASRITLEVVNVRVERITDISDSDCYAEGIISPQNDILGEPYYSFKDLWDTINAKRGYPWASNPWVWVIEFRRVSP